MRDDADDLLELTKDAVTIIRIYKGDLVRALYHQFDRTCDWDGFFIALESAKVTRWWLERAARVLGGVAADAARRELRPCVWTGADHSRLGRSDAGLARQLCRRHP